ncbi:MAG: NAD(+)/NADH kinase [Desulfovermiculus sp.]|nr:NAD(+)/NADH kinase [Desulfovermiculus sp.]
MHTPITSVHLITKSGHAQANRLGIVIQDWLHKQGCQALIVPSDNYTHTVPGCSSLPDLILVLGGDGTLLRIAGQVVELGLPVLGLNFGRVGFLTALSPQDWEAPLREILQGKYRISERIVLGYELRRRDDLVQEGRFINDLVVGRSGLARLVRLSLWNENKLMTRLRADGIIVSTPVGSTAYVAAAGGGLISPELEVMEICPVCPFMSDFRPLILSSREGISIQMESSSPESFVTLDGQSGWPLQEGDVVTIQACDSRFRLIEPEQSSFFEHLQRAGYFNV